MKGFVKISKYSGMREDLVQAGGGNSSFKISEEKMAIKASGYQLADMTEQTGYALVNPQIIRQRFLGCEDLDALTDADSKTILEEAFLEGNRPSIETFLHAISGKYTLHTHPMVVNVLTCRKGGMDILRELFPDALLVPYATPGVELAKAYFKAYKSKNADDRHIYEIVFLQNHGLVVSADSAEEVIGKTEAVTKKIEEYLGIDLRGYHNLSKLWNYFPDKVVWRVTDTHAIAAADSMDNSWNHTFCPDCVVFLGKKLMNLPDTPDETDVSSFVQAYGQPVMVRWDGCYYILADSVKKAMETQSVMSFSAQVMALNKGVDCDFLSDQEQNRLLNWDAEKYRRNMK
ncbi:MAG: class II aldolase/adducin family protein [Clostridiales bacterium]|nr:class II aldolase/adducin family protein [Clostridiales bacterium]